jgi:hypothetical protein
VDLDAGRAWWGRRLSLQVLGQGSAIPDVKWAGPVLVPRDDQPPIHFDVELRADETRWLVLRVSDPEQADPGEPGSARDSYGAAIAYSSPFFLTPVAHS